MGNALPDLCVCKEREGKTKSKKKPKAAILDKNLSIIDYTGYLPSGKKFSEVKNYLESFTIYEISCVRNPLNQFQHSDIRIKCFGPDMNLSYIKVSFMTYARAFIRIYPISYQDDEGLLEYNFKLEGKVNYNGNVKILLDFIEENEKLSKENENQGKTIYNYMKKLMESNSRKSL